MSKIEDITINKDSMFSFVIAQTLLTLHNDNVINKEQVTSTKFLKNSNFLKKLINDLFFIFKLITKKKFLQTKNNSFFTQILSKLDLFSNTMESQIVHILTLENRIEKFTF